MSKATYTNYYSTIETWSQAKYPINNLENLLGSFSKALKEIYSSSEIENKQANQETYNSIYNKIMLNPIFDSHPIEFVWRDKESEFLTDISSAISLAHNIFETIETKNAYLISLAVAFKKSAPKDLSGDVLNSASELIYEAIFNIENSDQQNSNLENTKDDYSYLADGQALAFQIQYHRWMIINKSILPETSYMRNRFINIVIRKNFPKHTPNPENKTETSYAESRSKLKDEITQHMKFDKSELPSEIIEKWINSFINNVMLVYYGFYKWDKLRGDFYRVIDLETSQFGEKIPDQFEENNKEFSKFINLS